MHLSRTLFLLPALCSLAFADVVFKAPLAGDTREVGQGGNDQFADMVITFTESGTLPLLSDFVAFDIYLFAGSNTIAESLSPIKANGNYTEESTYSIIGELPGDVGASSENAYFLGISSKTKQGGTVVNYSDRFALQDMTGTFSPAISAALAEVSGLSGPATNTTLNNLSQVSISSSSPQTSAVNSISPIESSAAFDPATSSAAASDFASSSASNPLSSSTTIHISQTSLSSIPTSTSISTSRTDTSSTTSAPIGPAPHSATPQQRSKNILSTGIIAGITVTSFAALCVLSATFYIFRRHRRIEVLEIPRKKAQLESPRNKPQLVELPEAGHRELEEVETREKLQEMETTEKPQELSASRYNEAVRHELYGDEGFKI